jgi:demethylmenaquinone methyltransferase / 2-methoxy-6-polyprenyl-1,4-benzoquinol methylase
MDHRGDRSFAQALFAPLPSHYELLAQLLGLGQYRRWRSAMVARAVAESPGLILDVATGPAGVAIQLAQGTPCHVIGLDLSEEMLAEGRKAIDGSQLSERISLVLGTADRLPFPDASFDALTFSYLLRYVTDPAATLVELARVVKPGGVMASVEFAVPPNPMARAAWLGYTRLVLPVAGAVTGGRGWYRVGRFLGPSITDHYRRYPVDWLIEAWNGAGIGDVEARRMSLGGGIVVSGRRQA